MSTPNVKDTKDTEQKDIFDTIFNVSTNFIDECNKLQAQYAQAISNISQELMDTWKKGSDTYATLMQTYMHNIYGPIKVPQIISKSITDTIDMSSKINNISNKTVISGLEVIRQNIKVLNDNIDTFTKLYTNLINTWSNITRKS